MSTALEAHADAIDELVSKLGDALCREDRCKGALRALIATLEEVREQLERHFDIEDGETGPLPNWAMRLSHDIELELADAKAVLR